VSTIQVVSPGLLTTVQDLGREGFGPLGVSASGAADPLALRIGNRLVSNEESAAALEMTLVGGTFLFPEGAVVALTGSDFGATLDGIPVPVWTSQKVKQGQTLRFEATRSGARCYLCVQGGIVVPLFLGSASTHVLSGLGGHEGRALREGDILKTGTEPAEFRPRIVNPTILHSISPRKLLRVTPGPQSDWFPEQERRKLCGCTYLVSEESNRMGLRLTGPALVLAPERSSGQMLTEGVSVGAIQVPEGGHPIILFVEQQTTGGYPKIANVIAADLPSVGQLRPRDEIQFHLVDWDAARSALRKQENMLASRDAILERDNG
jgi:antagonist of KipI